MVINNGYPSAQDILYGSCTYNQSCNLDLKNLTGLQIMDKLISYMAVKGIFVVLLNSGPNFNRLNYKWNEIYT